MIATEMLQIVLSSIIVISGLFFLVKYSHQIVPRNKQPMLFLFVKILSIFVIVFLLLAINRKYISYNRDLNWQQIIFSSFAISIALATLLEGVDFFRHWKRYVLRSERIEKANLIAKYETLKKQIQPHFLFNGLNTLIGLIENGDHKASAYAQNLSDFLKYLLTHQDKEYILLSEELLIVNQYAFVQQVRFDNNIKVNIDIRQNLMNNKIPPLALQMLVENAIKHNIASKAKPLCIEIKSIGKDFISVENNLQRKANVESSGIGLKNINERYRFISEKKPEVIENDNVFIVKLPLI